MFDSVNRHSRKSIAVARCPSTIQCVGCGKCEQHCPQHIEIRGELKAAAGELETVKYKFMKTAIGVLKLW